MIRADLNERGRTLSANTTHINLSIVTANNIRTDTSLESMESAPTNRQRRPLLQATSCWKYSPFHWRSLIAMINR